MPIIKDQRDYNMVAKQWKALVACQRAMQDLDSALGKADSDVSLEDQLVAIDAEIRDLADALADADEVSSSHEFAVQMGSAAP